MKRFGYTASFAGGGRGHGQHGRADHAAGHGCGRLHHGRDHRRALRRDLKAAIIPALLYFGTAFWMVHLEAGRRGLLGLPRRQCPSAHRGLARAAGIWSCRCRPGLAAVRRLHAAVRGHGRAGTHRHRGPGRRRRPGASAAQPAGPASGSPLGLAAVGLPAARHQRRRRCSSLVLVVGAC